MYLSAIEWRDEARDSHKVMDAQKTNIEALRSQLAETRARLQAAEGERDANASLLANAQHDLDIVRIQLGNMLFNLKQQPDMKRITDSIESVMDSVGWDKS